MPSLSSREAKELAVLQAIRTRADQGLDVEPLVEALEELVAALKADAFDRVPGARKRGLRTARAMDIEEHVRFAD
jgi:hypothetical protein